MRGSFAAPPPRNSAPATNRLTRIEGRKAFRVIRAGGTTWTPNLKHLITEPRTNNVTVFGRLNPRTSARTGDAVRVVVDAERLYLFNPKTEAAIW